MIITIFIILVIIMFKTIRISPLYAVIVMLLVFSLFTTSILEKKSIPASAKIENTEKAVPIIMYHAVSDVKSIQGEYVISSEEFESDLNYIKRAGLKTIFVDDLVGFVKGKNDLPDKSIILTFDDGYYNNYLYVYPLLKKYNERAVISPVAYYSELYTQSGEVSECYSHCTWQQLKEMADSGLIEIGNHSYNCHTCGNGVSGLGQLFGETDDSYKSRIKNDISTAQDMIFKNTQVKCSLIAYPFGTYNSITEQTIKEMGFTAALTCTEGINYLTFNDNEKLYNLKRILRPHNKPLKELINLYGSSK